MKPIKETFFPIQAVAAKRSTQKMYWLCSISEEDAILEEQKWVKTPDKNGYVWIRRYIDRSGKNIVKTKKSKPNYVSDRKYLLAELNAKKAVQMFASSIEFEMPQDAFHICFYFGMPKSWTKKKKKEMQFQRHKSKKDADNLTKFVFDAICAKNNPFKGKKQFDDRNISSYACTKIYVPNDTEVGFSITEYSIEDWNCCFL